MSTHTHAHMMAMAATCGLCPSCSTEVQSLLTTFGGMLYPLSCQWCLISVSGVRGAVLACSGHLQEPGVQAQEAGDIHSGVGQGFQQEGGGDLEEAAGREVRAAVCTCHYTMVHGPY